MGVGPRHACARDGGLCSCLPRSHAQGGAARALQQLRQETGVVARCGQRSPLQQSVRLFLRPCYRAPPSPSMMCHSTQFTDRGPSPRRRQTLRSGETGKEGTDTEAGPPFAGSVSERVFMREMPTGAGSSTGDSPSDPSTATSVRTVVWDTPSLGMRREDCQV